MKRSLFILAVVTVLLASLSTLAHAQAPIIIIPQDSGTIRLLPELGIFGEAPVGTAVQSTYFKTTIVNREFRRGFFEFEIPKVQGEILKATLILTETRAQVSRPIPPDVHELSYYHPADLIVNIDDFDRPTYFLTTFETDGNLPPQTFSFDITNLLIEFEGSSLGFRVKLTVDPTYEGMGWLGSGFGSLWANPPRIETITVEALKEEVQNIKDQISSYSTTSFNAPNEKAAKNLRKALLNMLDRVYEYIDTGDYQAAIDQLEDILAKSDGLYPPYSAPDWIGNDPSTPIIEQQEVAQLVSNLIADLQALL